MTNADKIDRRVRFAMGALIFVVATLIGHLICRHYGIDPNLGFGLLVLGYITGRISRGIDR